MVKLHSRSQVRGPLLLPKSHARQCSGPREGLPAAGVEEGCTHLTGLAALLAKILQGAGPALDTAAHGAGLQSTWDDDELTAQKLKKKNPGTLESLIWNFLTNLSHHLKNCELLVLQRVPPSRRALSQL